MSWPSLCLSRKKMGPQGPFRQKSVKRGEPSVASDRPFGPSPKAGKSLLSGLEDDRDRPVVDELDGHRRAEDALCDRDAERPQLRAEALVERLGLLRPRGRREAPATTP